MGSSRGGQGLTTADWVARVIAKRGERYDYSKVDYVDYMSPVLIICSKHGEFKQCANRHMQGDNCPVCANEARALAQAGVAKERRGRGNYIRKVQHKEADFGPLLAAWR